MLKGLARDWKYDAAFRDVVYFLLFVIGASLSMMYIYANLVP